MHIYILCQLALCAYINIKPIYDATLIPSNIIKINIDLTV